MHEKYPALNKLYESVEFRIVGKQYVWNILIVYNFNKYRGKIDE